MNLDQIAAQAAQQIIDEFIPPWTKEPEDCRQIRSIIKAAIEAANEWTPPQIDQAALAMVQETARYYGDPPPRNPDLSLTRLLVKAALQAFQGHPARVCPNCAKVFEQKSHNQRYCSNHCRYTAKAKQRAALT